MRDNKIASSRSDPPKGSDKNLQVSVWRVAAVQKVRASSPHSTLDSLVARFRQLRPDLVRIKLYIC